MTKVFIKFFLILNFSFFILQLSTGCKKDLTPVDNTQPEIRLFVEDVGVTEVWLRVETADGKPDNRITIQRNDSTILQLNSSTLQQLNNSTFDTLIYDSGLLPNHDYTYTATLTTEGLLSGVEIPITDHCSLRTMDTTSHDFSWQSWTFGAKGSSILYDCAIIAPDDIWCVGEIYTEDTYTYDSLGNWIDPYNAVHWDGNEWELKRILTKASFGEPRYVHLRSIFAFSENDIWITNYVGGYGHWNGNEWQTDWVGAGENKIWGISSNDIYFVGSVGIISHFNGQTWQRIESGTQDTFFDIWGIDNSLSNENPIYLPAFDNLYTIDNNHQVNNMNWSFPDKPIRSVWFKNKYQVFGCGENVFKKSFTKEWQVMPDTSHDDLYMISLRGQNVNDIFVIGNFGLTLHYNGTSWKRYFNQNNNMYWSVSYKNNVMVAVGEIWYSSPHQAIILMINRN